MASVPSTVRLPPQSMAFNEPEWLQEHEERAYFERKRGMQPLKLFGTGLPKVAEVHEEWAELVEAMTNGWTEHFFISGGPLTVSGTVIATPGGNWQQQLSPLLTQANPYVGPYTPYQQTQANSLSPGNFGSLGGLGMGRPAPGDPGF